MLRYILEIIISCYGTRRQKSIFLLWQPTKNIWWFELLFSVPLNFVRDCRLFHPIFLVFFSPFYFWKKNWPAGFKGGRDMCVQDSNARTGSQPSLELQNYKGQRKKKKGRRKQIRHLLLHISGRGNSHRRERREEPLKISYIEVGLMFLYTAKYTVSVCHVIRTLFLHSLGKSEKRLKVPQ